MTSAWNAAAPPELPAGGRAARWRLAWRLPSAVMLTAAFFALFAILRGTDALATRILRRPVRVRHHAIRNWARVALRLAGLRCRRRGLAMAAPGALVANHASWLDIVALQSTAVPAFVSKSEVADWPGIGFIGRAIGTVFIARRAQEARAQTAQLEARLRTGDLLCIFPEGTSTDGQRVLPFKSTLFQVFLGADPAADLWVQPVSLRYRAPPGLPADFYGWWGSMDFAGHLRAVLAQSRGGEVAVIFHPPLRARDFPSRKALAQAAGAAVRAGFETAFSADGR